MQLQNSLTLELEFGSKNLKKKWEISRNINFSKFLRFLNPYFFGIHKNEIHLQHEI